MGESLAIGYVHPGSTLSNVMGKVRQDETGCWIWDGNLSQWGYAKYPINVHRFTYEQFVGLIPEGLEINHLCEHPACVNPEHLEAVTHRENMAYGHTIIAQQLRRTHCPEGHPYDGPNLYTDPRGNRQCRECRRRDMRAYRGRRRSA